MGVIEVDCFTNRSAQSLTKASKSLNNFVKYSSDGEVQGTNFFSEFGTRNVHVVKTVKDCEYCQPEHLVDLPTTCLTCHFPSF